MGREWQALFEVNLSNNLEFYAFGLMFVTAKLSIELSEIFDSNLMEFPASRCFHELDHEALQPTQVSPQVTVT